MLLLYGMPEVSSRFCLHTKLTPHTYFLQLQQTAFRKDDPLVLESIGNLAFAKAKNAEVTKAILLYTGLLHLLEGSSNNSRDYYETMGILGFLFYHAEDYEESLQNLNATYKWQQAHDSMEQREHTYKTIKKVQLMVQRK